MYIIRRAQVKDIEACLKLLVEVCNVHANIRPDLFKKDMTKYNKAELEKIFKDDNSPVFVYEENNLILGYGFTQIINYNSSINPTNIKSLYIDDICIEENVRGNHIGKKIFDYIVSYARSINCYNITLNVWEGNTSAKKFYESLDMNIQKYTMEKIL